MSSTMSAQSIWLTRNPEFHQIKTDEDALRAKILSGETIQPYESLIKITPEISEELSSSFKAARGRNIKSRDPQRRTIISYLKAKQEKLTNDDSRHRPLLANVSEGESSCSYNANTEYFKNKYAYSIYSLISSLHPQVRKHVVLAGGAPLNRIMRQGRFHDFDLFIVGTDNPGEIVQAIIDHFHNSSITRINYCMRTEHSITLSLSNNNKIQIVLRSYKTPAEVVVGFDLDASGCCWHEDALYCTPRAYYSIKTACLYVDLNRMSTTYNQRLVKYAKDKGFSIDVPCEITIHHLNEALYLFSRYFLSAFRVKKTRNSRFELDSRKILNDSLIGLLVTQFLGERATRIPGFATTSDYCPVSDADFEKNKEAASDEISQSSGINFFRTDDAGGVKTTGYGFRTWNLSPQYVYDLGNLTKYIQESELELNIPPVAKFITENPGTQFSASFHPVDMTWDKWLSLDVAIDFGETTPPTATVPKSQGVPTSTFLAVPSQQPITLPHINPVPTSSLAIKLSSGVILTREDLLMIRDRLNQL